jgi:dTMP kinase
MFITFEGTEGGGKTTQISALARRLAAIGHTVIQTRQPGGDELGARLRALMLDRSSIEIEPMAELLMMMSDRAQSVNRIIRPALDSGSTVLCDRYADSSVAYQGYGHGIDLDIVHELNRIATGNLVPDLTILLDIDPRIGLKRQTEHNRMEAQGTEFHRRIRSGYIEMARAEPDRFAVIDASQAIDEVAADIWRNYEAHHSHRP